MNKKPVSKTLKLLSPATKVCKLPLHVSQLPVTDYKRPTTRF